MNKTCKWTWISQITMDKGYYETGCGFLFCANSATKKETLFKFCPYCGGEIICP